MPRLACPTTRSRPPALFASSTSPSVSPALSLFAVTISARPTVGLVVFASVEGIPAALSKDIEAAASDGVIPERSSAVLTFPAARFSIYSGLRLNLSFTNVPRAPPPRITKGRPTPKPVPTVPPTIAPLMRSPSSAEPAPAIVPVPPPTTAPRANGLFGRVLLNCAASLARAPVDLAVVATAAGAAAPPVSPVAR